MRAKAGPETDKGEVGACDWTAFGNSKLRARRITRAAEEKECCNGLWDVYVDVITMCEGTCREGRGVMNGKGMVFVRLARSASSTARINRNKKE